MFTLARKFRKALAPQGLGWVYSKHICVLPRTVTCCQAPAPSQLTFTTKSDDDTERQLVHTVTCAHRDAIIFILSNSVLSLDRGGGLSSPLSSRAGPGPAHQSQAGPSCDGVQCQ